MVGKNSSASRLRIDDKAINNIAGFANRIDNDKPCKQMSVWRFQKLFVLDLPDPASLPLPVKKDDWGAPLITGAFKDSEALQSFPINKVQARYFKLIGRSGYTRKAASVAEMSFYGITAQPRAKSD